MEASFILGRKAITIAGDEYIIIDKVQVVERIVESGLPSEPAQVYNLSITKYLCQPYGSSEVILIKPEDITRIV